VDDFFYSKLEIMFSSEQKHFYLFKNMEMLKKIIFLSNDIFLKIK